MAADATWNQTINLNGGAGHNIGMDLANEFLNNEFVSELLKLLHQVQWFICSSVPSMAMMQYWHRIYLQRVQYRQTIVPANWLCKNNVNAHYLAQDFANIIGINFNISVWGTN